eukprot:TRINITY_DN6809_c0_g1_i1.p1 TRINITY_DN6809_c0_g1~~TRINITY_DN6809_c0_g1_i1.p1  ORF type:complete len:436 (-),score=122.80 TRINITY_DN6809_c0_g1_i1:39-1346(-)
MTKIAIVSPKTLEPYALLMKGGFLWDSSHGSLSIQVSLFTHDPNQEILTFSIETADKLDEFDGIIYQLHGSHLEIPVVFQKELINVNKPRVILIHRPEEVLERSKRGESPYPDISKLSEFLAQFSAVVLLGECHLKAYGEHHPKCVCIPHGFYNLNVIPESEKDIQRVCIVGAVTSFSDMRWISDLFKMHEKYMEKRQETGEGRIVFYASGSFKPFKPIGSEIEMDELKTLKKKAEREEMPVIFFTAQELQDKFSSGTEFNDAPSFKEWIFTASGEGRKVVVVEGFPASEEFKEIQLESLDFNVQLYRELLLDFKPKIEYSGSLHSAPHLNLPVVFYSPSAVDVKKEGMEILKVKFDPPFPQLSSFPALDPKELFFPNEFYPDFEPVLKEIQRLQRERGEYNEKLRRQHEKAQSLGFQFVAYSYIKLFKELKSDK